MAVSLVPETRSVLPGDSVTLAFVMRPRPSWHGYWRNPGDAGAEPRVQWRLPEGWQAGPLQYPVPDRLLVQGLMNYVFERDYVLLATLQVSPTAEPGVAVPVDVRLDYLVCTNELCVPERADLTVELRVGAGGTRDPAFDRLSPGAAAAARSAGQFRARRRAPAPRGSAAGDDRVDDPYFFPATPDALGHSAAQNVSRNGDMLIVETEAGRQAASLASIDGVLEIGPGIGLSLTATLGEVPAAGASSRRRRGCTGGGQTILLALLGALFGGLLLNIMPCVFRSSASSALSLARAGETAGRRPARGARLCRRRDPDLPRARRRAARLACRRRRHRLGLPAAGSAVILLLLLLVTAIALNLAGLFPFGNHRWRGSGAPRWRPRRLLHRRARGLRRHALHRSVPRLCARRRSGPADLAALAVFAGLGSAWPRPSCCSLRAALRRRLPSGRLDGALPAHPGRADVRDGSGSCLGRSAARAASTAWPSGSAASCCSASAFGG
jgi:hypothetical protein